jgi:hypothetical protein
VAPFEVPTDTLNNSFFIIRQHATSAPWTPRDERRRIGVNDTGEVFEQDGVIADGEGGELKVRRITIALNQPTEDGDTQIHLYTNLPPEVCALVIASAYRQRWTLEAAFNELTLSLRCEINTLGYPKAALFAFCLAASLFNVLSVMRAALRAVHGREKVEENLSTYYVADEVAGVSRGMTAILPPCYWRERFGNLRAAEMVKILLALAEEVDIRRFQKSKRGPENPPPKRTRGETGHYAASRVLANKNASFRALRCSGHLMTMTPQSSPPLKAIKCNQPSAIRRVVKATSMLASNVLRPRSPSDGAICSQVSEQTNAEIA